VEALFIFVHCVMDWTITGFVELPVGSYSVWVFWHPFYPTDSPVLPLFENWDKLGLCVAEFFLGAWSVDTLEDFG
jgi:hypothetical protein